MSKKSLFALLLAAVMVLSGCSLVMKDQDVDNMLTIIDVNGTKVNKQTFLNTYEYNLYIEQYYASMLASFGGNSTVDENKVMEDTVNTIISSFVTNQKIKELGFDVLTEEEENAILVSGEEAYKTQLESVKEFYFADTELTGEELDAAILAEAEANGITLESMQQNERSTFISERLRASVTDSITVDDAALQAELDALIAEEKADYAESLSYYGARINNGTKTYYTPAGYRKINVIEIAKAAQENAEATDAGKEEANALIERLNAGEAFETLTETVESLIVCESSTDLDEALVSAAMALATAGEVSGLVETEDSYALIQYVEEIEESQVTLEEVREELHDEALATAQDAAYEAAVAQWVSEADVKIYYENLYN